MAYAESTSVSSEKSRAEIDRVIGRYGAEQFAYGWDQGRAMVGFKMHNRQIRFILPLPDRNSREFKQTPTGRGRTSAAAEAAYEQAVRQKWRALALVIKAKLEAVESGIVTFEQEFLANIVLPNGQTVGEWTAPQIEGVYATHDMPALLPGLTKEIE